MLSYKATTSQCDDQDSTGEFRNSSDQEKTTTEMETVYFSVVHLLLKQDGMCSAASVCVPLEALQHTEREELSDVIVATNHFFYKTTCFLDRSQPKCCACFPPLGGAVTLALRALSPPPKPARRQLGLTGTLSHTCSAPGGRGG